MKTNASFSANPITANGVMMHVGEFLLEILTEIFGETKVDPKILLLTTPPSAEMGDFAFGCFGVAKILKANPVEIAKQLEAVAKVKLAALASNLSVVEKVSVAGPYLNITLNRNFAGATALSAIFEQGNGYGKNNSLSGRKIMVEYLSPNTNKPLHIGHLRNGVLGTSIANLLSANGARVIKANNINDRGIHIIKSMIAYQMFGNGQTPESTGEKGDHFVGRFYVMYNQEETRLYADWLKAKGLVLAGMEDADKESMRKEFEKECPLIQKSYQMLQQWEAGEKEVMTLWEKMNNWVYSGFAETNCRMGFTFDAVYFESQTYKLGKIVIMQQLENGICQKGDGQSVVIDLTTGKIGAKPIMLIRNDGTSVYMTQDIGLAQTRFVQVQGLTDIIYVVAHEQDFHFRALFEILKRFGYPWCSGLYHLSYGMVNLPSGKMKSREGKVVDADDLISQLHTMAEKVISGHGQGAGDNINERAEMIALGALKYMLISVSPTRDLMFDPEKSVSFEGNTGPYLQYACVRISAIEEKARKFAARVPIGETSDEEFDLIKKLMLFGDVLLHAAENYDASILTTYLHELAQTFSSFYAACPVIQDQCVNAFRLKICRATRQVLSSGLEILGIPVPDRM